MSQPIIPDDPFGSVKQPVTKQYPTAQEVNRFHTASDCDSSQDSQHHKLGTGHNQASPGDHIHNGQTSKQLMAGVTITGAKGGNVALTNLITALASAFGFTDSTT